MSDLYKEGWEAAIEAAVKTQCGACRLGMPVRLGHRPWSFMKDEYFHLLKEDGSTLWDKCGGSAIHALETPATCQQARKTSESSSRTDATLGSVSAAVEQAGSSSVTAQPSTKGEEDEVETDVETAVIPSGDSGTGIPYGVVSGSNTPASPSAEVSAVHIEFAL